MKSCYSKIEIVISRHDSATAHFEVFHQLDLVYVIRRYSNVSAENPRLSN